MASPMHLAFSALFPTEAGYETLVTSSWVLTSEDLGPIETYPTAPMTARTTMEKRAIKLFLLEDCGATVCSSVTRGVPSSMFCIVDFYSLLFLAVN